MKSADTPEPFGVPEVTANPYPFYDWARRHSPVYQIPGTNDFLLTRYDDIQFVVSRPDIFSNSARSALKSAAALRYQDRPALEDNDPPDHSDVRKAVMPIFSPARIKGYQVHIQREVDDLISAFENEPTIEFMADFAVKLPPRVIGSVFGLPRADIARLKTWAGSFSEIRGLIGVEPNERVLNIYAEFSNYCGDLVLERRESPGDDPVSALAIARRPDGSFFPVEQLMNALRNLLTGGTESSILMLSNGLVDLLRHADQIPAATDTRGWQRAIDEILRKDAPAQYTGARRCTRDFEFHGVIIPKGARILTGWGAANRDPSHFDDPDRFDVARGQRGGGQIAFGLGPHFCVGASLAHAEGVVAFKTLFERFPQMRLSPRNSFERSTRSPNLRAYKDVWIDLRPS